MLPVKEGKKVMEEIDGSTYNFEEKVLFIINMLRPFSIEPVGISLNYATFVYNGKPTLLDKLFKTKYIQSIFKEIDEITRG